MLRQTLQERIRRPQGGSDVSKVAKRHGTPLRSSGRESGSPQSDANRDILSLRKENKHLRKYLLSLVNVIKWFDNRLSAEMILPPSYERGKRIARLTNALNYAREGAEYHGLKVDYRKAKDLTEGQRVALDKQFQQIREVSENLREHTEALKQDGN